MSQPTSSSRDPLARIAESQHWISSEVEESVQHAIQSAFENMGPAGGTLRSALHGDWLHEPLHAVLTDIPIGAWTSAVVCDAVGALTHSDRLDAAADASVVVGLLGAAGAAITGMNDWAAIKQEKPRRIGTIHALLNIGATALFIGSCFTRMRRQSRGIARSLALLGYVVVSMSAHLGGNLVYEHGMGVAPAKSAED